MPKKQLQDRLKTELFNQVPLNIAVIDKKYNIVEANSNFEDKFGEWQGKKCYTVFKDRKKRCKKCIASLTFEDGQCHVDDELGQDKFGRPTRYVLNTAPVKDSNGSIDLVMEMIKDVTEEKELERDHQILFRRVPNCIAVMDRNYRIVRANEKFRATYGSDVIGKKCFNVYKKQDVSCSNCPAELTFRDGKVHHSEQTGITKDGIRNNYVTTTAPLGRTGEKFAHIMEISTDVTEIRSLQHEIRQLNEYQEKLIKSSLDAIIVLNKSGKTLIFNEAAEKLFGISADKALGNKSIKKYLPKEFLSFLKRNESFCIIPDTVILTADKKEIPVRFSGVILKDNGNVQGSAAFMQDLTEVKILEEENMESERMAAVGHTVAGLAHGVKNILTGIQGGMYSMKTGLERSDAGRIFGGWEMLERNIEKVTIFVKDFLSFSKGEKPLVELINPAKIAADVVLLYKDAAEQNGVKVVSEIGNNIGNAYFDSDGLHACLANLVSNAIDACLLSDRKDRNIIVRLFEQDKRIVFEVLDNGIGMEYEVKKKVFTNFFTTKGTKGTGIGLLTTRKIVTQHGGDIEFESEKNKGSVFRISFLRETLNTLKDKN
ncbi:PAS domain S-box protein [candidate division KSB1 bacterium]